MSVSQVKKRFEELGVYLGSDTKGKELLRKLKDSVNELRTSLADAAAKQQESEHLACVMSSRAKRAEAELSDMSLDVERLRNINANLSSRIAKSDEVRQSIEVDSVAKESAVLELELKRVVKALIKRQGTCPRPVSVTNTTANHKIYTFNREHLSAGWSHDAIWTLGASMAVLSAVFGTVVLETDVRAKDMRRVHDINADESWGRLWWRWADNLVSKNDLGSVIPASCAHVNGMETRYNPYR